jgi:hypothetical protein
VLDPAHPITAFFDDDPERVLASLGAIDASSGKLSSLDTLYRLAGEVGLRGHRDGLFAESIFGPEPDRFGHIETVGVVHPSVFPELVEALQIDTPMLVAIARGEKLLRGDRVIDGLIDLEEGDLTGPRGIAEAVRRVSPEHPLLPLCTITKIPVPPIAARPTRMGAGPEAVDPWIGPVNEAWLRLIEHAIRDARLIELDAPPIILANEAGLLQRAFDEVFVRTQRAEARLVPAMSRGVEEEVIALAFAGPERVVIQRGTGIRVVDVSGRELRRAAPSGCTLRGVIDEHLAVFHEIRRDLHPHWPEEEDGLWPTAFVEHGIRHVIGEISVLDVDTGEYLERAPASVPRTFVENDQPEELLLGERRLDVGGDRPRAEAYTNDLRFAWIGGESTEVIALATGLTVARPASTFPDDVTVALDLASGEIIEHEWDDQGGGGACALAFAEGRWFVLDDYGVLRDHIGNDAIVLVPTPVAAAFDPSGARLAVCDGNEVIVIDRSTRAIVARFGSQS